MFFLFSLLMLLVVSENAEASCSFAEQAEKSGKTKIAYMQYIYCAEEENDAEAQYKLGAMYYQGVGLPQPDFRRAVAFFSRSAKNGYAPAQVKLGLLYWRGEGITRNMRMAHKWLYLAQEPAELRWFYNVGPSFDQTAASMYSKINGAIKLTDKDVAGVIPFSQTVPLENLKGFIPSYKDVAEFQHEKLLEAGQDFLDETGQSDLQRFLSMLKPDITIPATVPDEKRQMILNWLKPVVLTQKNMNPSKVPVLDNLKKEIDTTGE